MSSRSIWWFAAVAIVIVAAWFRFAALSSRIMHTDEAVHAVKFGQLLEDGYYRYDPYEYHGPTLNYFSLVPAWIGGADTIQAVSEPMLRAVPAALGLALVLLIFLLKPAGSWAILICGAFLTAVSPAMVFYSRYYIQEMLLVFFLFAMIVLGYRYLLRPRALWLVGASLAAGGAFATKETCVISFGAAVMAGAVVLISQKQLRQPFVRKITAGSLCLAILPGLALAVVFYSSFFSHPAGIVDSVRTFTTYLARAGGDGRHGNPWYYFARMLLFWHEGTVAWSEWIIFIPALAGVVISFAARDVRARGFWQFLGLYGLIQLVIYSAIPYKTPWCLITFLQPMAIVAGFAVVWAVRNYSGALRPAIAAVAIIGFVHLGLLSYLNNFRYFDDPHNPYVHSHPRQDFRQIEEKLRQIKASYPEPVMVQVIVSDHEYWPLPWYLRDFPQVGYHSRASLAVAQGHVIVCDLQQEPELVDVLYRQRPPGRRGAYLPALDEPAEFRPGLPGQVYVQADVWTWMTQQPVGSEQLDE